MGIKATDFEKSALGTVSSSAAGSYHVRNDVSSGLQSHAVAIQSEYQTNAGIAGLLGRGSEIAKKIGDAADKAYSMRKGRVMAVANSKDAFDKAKAAYDNAMKPDSGASAEQIQGLKLQMDSCRDAYNSDVTMLKGNQTFLGQFTQAWSKKGYMKDDYTIYGAQ